MKILLINNHTQHLEFLNSALSGNQIEVLMYQPGVEFNWQDKDLIVLSGGGGEGLEINDSAPNGRLWYHDEMEFILSCDKPILGICMGFEVIARAYGSKVEEMTELVMGYRKLATTKRGKSKLAKDNLKQYEAHQWHVTDVDTNKFDVLAESKTGIEIIKHRTRPILATQFHPEKGGTLKLPSLVGSL